MTADQHPGILGIPANPRDLRALSDAESVDLAGRIRTFLIDKVCATGGHLGVNLGVVEVTIALHRVFDSPHDPILFDTGHQSYVHKILTGRAGDFDGLRRDGGLAGYPSAVESDHDWVENSHASTALAYADGLTKAFALTGQTDRVVAAVIGDGACTGGLAWEGLNNLAARPDRPLVVVLNDNGRSYDPTIGGIGHHLAELRAGGGQSIFGQLGLSYLGPVDGHDLPAVQDALRQARSRGRTVVVHVVTEKGRGYLPAEQDPADRMHAIGVIDPGTGKPTGTAAPTWTDTFAAEMLRIGEQRPEVVCVTAAMTQPVGLRGFAEAFPDRVFDTGIAEQHAVCSAAGLAMAGLHPVVAVYSTFLNRAFDQVLLDVALHGLPVTFVLDRAGITGPDGPSHHGMWDLGILGTIPGIRVAAPRDPERLRELLGEALDHTTGPTVVRFPKSGVSPPLPAISRISGMDILFRSRSLPLDVLLVAVGTTAQPCMAAASALDQAGFGVTVVDPRWIDPVDPALVHLIARHRAALTVEDACVSTGVGARVALACAQENVGTRLRAVGLPRQFLRHASRPDLLRECGIDAAALTETARTLIASTPAGVPVPAKEQP
ncbi:1-deoxy-D-xylulose-5-phosphate synthase [Nocardia sp. NPDC050712]|uniref:1-deoxy-D-xylulose-5-phosphate synthase n=1 Tax=Nocardia sp. NPDC050712 TaxID=3155518 RepID=UPI00340589E8